MQHIDCYHYGFLGIFSAFMQMFVCSGILVKLSSMDFYFSI